MMLAMTTTALSAPLLSRTVWFMLMLMLGLPSVTTTTPSASSDAAAAAAAASWPAGVLLTPRLALLSCLQAAAVPVELRDADQCTLDLQPFNTRLPYRPLAVAIPRSVAHVQAAVACGVRHGVRVTAKGGGHSFGSTGLGGEDGHLLLVMDRMHRVELEADGMARIQAGARLGHVVAELQAQGRRAFAFGTCPSVGIAGLVLHGGYGMSSRKYGLAVDWLKGATVVLANSSAVHCSESEHPDLFWALRGAGSSFAIAVELEFDTFQTPETVTTFEVRSSWNDVETATAGLLALQELAIRSPPELSVMFLTTVLGQYVRGFYYGDEASARGIMAGYMDVSGSEWWEIETSSWLGAAHLFGDWMPLSQMRPDNWTETFYSTGVMTKALSRKTAESFMGMLIQNRQDRNARHTWNMVIDTYGGPNSAVSATSQTATSYAHRDKLLKFQFQDRGFRGALTSESAALVNGVRDTLTRDMAPDEWGLYVNYLDTEVEPETARKLYWGENLPRLARLKAEWDPYNVFWSPQGVEPVYD